MEPFTSKMMTKDTGELANGLLDVPAGAGNIKATGLTDARPEYPPPARILCLGPLKLLTTAVGIGVGEDVRVGVGVTVRVGVTVGVVVAVPVPVGVGVMVPVGVGIAVLVGVGVTVKFGGGGAPTLVFWMVMSHIRYPRKSPIERSVIGWKRPLKTSSM